MQVYWMVYMMYKQCWSPLSSVTAHLFLTPRGQQKILDMFSTNRVPLSTRNAFSDHANFSGQWISFPRFRSYVRSKAKIELLSAVKIQCTACRSTSSPSGLCQYIASFIICLVVYLKNLYQLFRLHSVQRE